MEDGQAGPWRVPGGGKDRKKGELLRWKEATKKGEG